ncbi:MAG: potassium transporter Kup [Hyphomicrobium sp.]|jgi:KUP system potassium uptake protein
MAQSVVPSEGPEAPNPAEPHAPASNRFFALTLGSIGVVYGDIGTSPLYAFREALVAAGGGGVSRAAVLGVLSLILWALILIVTCKYVLILLRADNNGEGGTLTLMALAQRAVGKDSRVILWFGILGAALFFGDALITPAISVLSAMEGLKIVTPAFEHSVVPLTVLILVALFAVQSRGTASVAAFFGPITTVWFIVIGVAGATHIADDPSVLAAINPAYGISFLLGHGMIGFVTLGAVFLAVTGAEALYADLGHFGRAPIQTAWLVLVLPALVLNYFGQGALVLARPEAIENPFFLLFPDWMLLPIVVLATAATVIASQAVISGAYSLARQAIALGLLPRLDVRHTSAEQEGQIYMPLVNTALLLGVLLLVGLFRTSSALASAYGIAVTGTMVVTAAMAFVVIWRVWGWSPLSAGLLIAPFLVIDATFLAANLLKFVEGGWLPLAFAGALSTVMYTWQHGNKLLLEKTRRLETPLESLVAMLEKKPPHRVPGTAVFFTSDPQSAPTALMHSLKHYKVLHEKNVILSVLTVRTPRVSLEERVKIEPIGETFSRVTLRFGYMESPNVPRALGIARKLGWQFDIMSTSFFLSRRLLKAAARSEMPRWQDRLFIALTRIANDATTYFQIPTGRVVEVGTQVTV